MSKADGSSSTPEQAGRPVAPAAAADKPAEELAAELAATRERLLRALADQENIRQQARRERDEAVRFAAAGFAGDLLATADNLERAIASVPEDKRADAVTAGLLAGIEATRRALLDAFAKHGMRRVDPIGEWFDPHRHQASFEMQDDQHPPGTVAAVIQPGYMHHERLLRPALVGVSQARDSQPQRRRGPES